MKILSRNDKLEEIPEGSICVGHVLGSEYLVWATQEEFAGMKKGGTRLITQSEIDVHGGKGNIDFNQASDRGFAADVIAYPHEKAEPKVCDVYTLEQNLAPCMVEGAKMDRLIELLESVETELMDLNA